VSQNAQVGELTSTTLTLLFPGPGLATAFRGGPHAEVVQRAVRETLGFDVRVEGRVGDGASSGTAGAARPAAAEPARAPRGSRDTGADRVVDRASAEASWATVEPPDDDIPEGPTVDVVPPDLEPPQDQPGGRSSARAAGERAHAESLQRTVAAGPAVEDSPSPDDPDIASSNLTGPPLVAQLLGGTVIDEQLGDEL
jgi:DNA polymerase-3 subunit gamma/tau